MRNRLVASLLALFLGGLGIHKFYLGRIAWGVVYLVFCWTGIPSVVGFLEGVILISQSDVVFNRKYNNGAAS